MNWEYGTRTRPWDVVDWDVSLAFPTLTKEQVYAPVYMPEFWEQIAPVRNAQKYIKQIIDDGHAVYLVTATNYQTCHAKMVRFLELFPFFCWDDVVVTSFKQLLRADILIDDKPENLIGGGYDGILFDQYHNRKYDERQHGFVRAVDWHNAYQEVCRIANDSSETCPHYLRPEDWEICSSCRHCAEDNGAMYCVPGGYSTYSREEIGA